MNPPEQELPLSRRLKPKYPDALSLVWVALRHEASGAARGDVALASLLATTILNHESLSAALSYHLAHKLGDLDLDPMRLRDLIVDAYAADPSIVEAAACDLTVVVERDPSCRGFVRPFLFFKGFLALQAHRVAHWQYRAGRVLLASFLQSRSSELFHVDIHPAARIGRGVFVDHGVGIVIGETAVVGDDVSILQEVTLGGVGSRRGDRHPTIGNNVLLAAGATVLGDIHIGDGAKIAAGSVVLKDVPAGCTAVGVPARLVNCPTRDSPC